MNFMLVNFPILDTGRAFPQGNRLLLAGEDFGDDEPRRVTEPRAVEPKGDERSLFDGAVFEQCFDADHVERLGAGSPPAVEIDAFPIGAVAAVAVVVLRDTRELSLAPFTDRAGGFSDSLDAFLDGGQVVVFRTCPAGEEEQARVLDLPGLDVLRFLADLFLDGALPWLTCGGRVERPRVFQMPLAEVLDHGLVCVQIAW